MGAKTALLAFTEGDIRPALLGATQPDRSETEDLVRQLFPGYRVAPADDRTLDDGTNPPDDTTYATALAGADLFCDWRLVLDRPSELPDHLLSVADGRRIIMHGMHSVVDWLCFAVWEDGRLIRSLSLSPDGGIQEDIGEPFDFERPFRSGERPVEPWADDPDDEPYPLPFHPLELGEEALRGLFGFVLEGYPDSGDIDPGSVPLHGFQVVDPTGRERAARRASSARARSALGEPKFYRLGPDGRIEEFTP